MATSLLGDLGNSLFVLISGYFMVESAFRLRRVLRLWAEVFFYSLLFAALAALVGGETLGPRTWARVFFPVLPMITGLPPIMWFFPSSCPF